MARIAGVDLPRDKRIEIGLTYVYGIGKTSAKKILEQTGINPDTRVKDLTEDDEAKLRDCIDKNYVVEGDLRRSVALDVKRLMEIGCQKQTKRRCRNTLLFPKSIRGIPSGTMIICIVSCRLMKMPRFPSISCGGIRNQILKRSSRFSIGLKLEIRC